MPRVMDAFQTYLRELRAERSRRLGRALPAEGRADAPRQRRDRAEQINAVLFKEIVVQ